jgi:hypothetical protein
VKADDLRLWGAIKRTFSDYDSGLRAAGFIPADVRLTPAKFGEPAAQRLLDEIRAVAALTDPDRERAWKKLQKRYYRLVRSRRFGSWLKVFAEAEVERSLFPISPYDPRNPIRIGQPSRQPRPVRYPDRQAVLDAFRLRIEKSLPIHSTAVSKSDRHLANAVREHFGGFAKLGALLRLPTRKQDRRTYPNRTSVVNVSRRRRK